MSQTNQHWLYVLAGIASPHIRRSVASQAELSRQSTDMCHPLFGRSPARSRLKSRNSFLKTVQPMATPAEATRVNLWRDELRGKIAGELVENISEALHHGKMRIGQHGQGRCYPVRHPSPLNVKLGAPAICTFARLQPESWRPSYISTCLILNTNWQQKQNSCRKF